jgi:hypothetical protein
MLNLDIVRQFAAEANLDFTLANQFPDWFFLGDDKEQKAWALEVDRVQDQALRLKEKFSDQIVPMIEQQFPDLYRYVMDGYAKNNSFLSVLGHRYRQSTPVLNLGLVSNEIAEKYRFHLIWASAPERFDSIIRGIRSEKMVEAMNLEQFSRYLTRCQNAITKGIQSLAQLKETLRFEQDREAKLALEKATIDLVQISVSAANASSFTKGESTGTTDA